MVQFDHSKFLGYTAAQVFTNLVTSDECIDKIFVHTFNQPPLLQDRIVFSQIEKRVFLRASSLREEHALPFWDALLMSCLEAPTVPYRLLDAVTYHQDNSNSITIVSRSDVIAGALIKTSEATMQPRVAVLSKVILHDGSLGHIPILDFHCYTSSHSLAIVRAVCERLFDRGGFVLESGESYHGIGVGVLTPEAFLDFLSMSLLFCPIVDRAYVAHQLLHRACSLRISTGGRAQKIPRVVSAI